MADQASGAPRPTIGFVGTGAMGLPMARNLRRAGFPLHVFTRTPSRAALVVAEGAVLSASLAELAAHCDIVIACLNTVQASAETFLGVNGIAAHARPGTLWIDHATITPALARELGEAAASRGMEFLDAPVSGGPEGATHGTLAIMAGGSDEAFARALPVMQAYGQVVRHMGGVGTGTNTKLVNQLLTFVHGMAAAEALALAARLELDTTALLDVLRASFGQSRMLERTTARVQSANYEAGAPLQLYTKDLGIIADVARETGMNLPVLMAARALLDSALADGLGARDIAALRLRYPDADDGRIPGAPTSA